MIGGGSIRGVEGFVRWSYYQAAKLQNYRVRRSPKSEWSLSARVVESDAFKLSRSDLKFVAPHAKGEWVWPITELKVEKGTLTARLGPPIEAVKV